MPPDLWTFKQLEAIERRYPTPEVRALVAEITRLSVIAVGADELARALESVPLLSTPKLLLAALVERLEPPATGRKGNG